MSDFGIDLASTVIWDISIWVKLLVAAAAVFEFGQRHEDGDHSFY